MTIICQSDPHASACGPSRHPLSDEDFLPGFRQRIIFNSIPGGSSPSRAPITLRPSHCPELVNALWRTKSARSCLVIFRPLGTRLSFALIWMETKSPLPCATLNFRMRVRLFFLLPGSLAMLPLHHERCDVKSSNQLQRQILQHRKNRNSPPIHRMLENTALRLSPLPA